MLIKMRIMNQSSNRWKTVISLWVQRIRYLMLFENLCVNSKHFQQSDFELSDEDGNQQPSSNENPIDLCSIGQPPNLSAELPTLIKNDPTENRNSSNSAMSSSSSSKRKRFQPQKQSLKLDHSSADSNDEAALEEKSSSDGKHY